MPRPGRPFGVSLAIIASTFLFSVLPLLQVGMILTVRQHFLNMDFQDTGMDMIAMGGDLLGVPERSLILQLFLSLLFLLIAVFAWRGKPSFMRFVLVASVFAMTLIKLISIVAPLFSQPTPLLGASSLDGIMQSLGRGQFILELLVLFYVVWYMNRGPARAFYRGYYLTEPPETAPQQT